jgi:8-oxo-dGTP pyrophosphatase MutT (NUDIX family)
VRPRDPDATVSPGQWAFLGGRTEPEDGGDTVATWLRELREENGVSLDPAGVVSVADGTDARGVRYRVFAATWPEREGFVGTEGQRVAWFALEEALALPDLAPTARLDLLAFRTRPRARARP